MTATSTPSMSIAVSVESGSKPRPRATWKCGCRARLRRRSSRLDAGGRRLAMCGNRQPLDFHPHDGIGVAFVLGALAECPLLPAEELRWARSMWPFEIAGPEIVRLHHVKVAVEDQIAVACHAAPPPVSRDCTAERPVRH